ncbi:hypothetical protein HH308_11485 [Gordonia sp. TBRC 11910]|uniref:Uncharacterized protein n=1 Tax=Gordonia asplenii TaxID=2725283 RepID=A0A848KZK5_9ACTN|nr:hypothetical protein [Gordonia asplenii]NMO01833.1 hypothetical protein [Gordonia asplenii]
MITFALRWYRLGGGADETIREQLGLEPIRFFSIMLWHLATNPPSPIKPEVVNAISSVARRRIWLASLDIRD